MPVDLNLVIENEFEAFKDPASKRGPRHRSQKIGLNLNRKHQNVIAVSQKADPNAIGPLEKLRGLERGRGFVTHQVGMELKQKYGLDTDDGYLGTTGIRLIRTDKGYDLIKEAKIVIDGEYWSIMNPDDVYTDVPGSHTTFGVFQNKVYFVKPGQADDTHYDIVAHIGDGNFDAIGTYPPSKVGDLLTISNAYKWFKKKYRETYGPEDDWYDTGNPRTFFELAGRASEPEFNIVAFWNTITDINKHTNLLSGYFKSIGLKDPIIVASDNRNTKLGKSVVTNKIDHEAMTKQHIIPALKKMNSAAQYNKSGEVAVKAGYQSPAELNALKTIGDSVEQTRLVKETPEVILGKYPREDYTSYLFMGTADGKGAVFGPEKLIPSHSHIIRKLSKNDIEGLTFLGNATTDRKLYSHYRAGVILPKQGTDIEATYISCWSSQYRDILPFIDAYMKQINAQGPFFIEVSSVENNIHDVGTLEPYTPRG